MKKYIYLVAVFSGITFGTVAQSVIESVDAMNLNNAANDQRNAQIRLNQMQQKLREQQANKANGLAMNTVTGGKMRLEQFFHDIDFQLSDKLGSFKLFSVVEGKDLKNILGSATITGAATSETTRRKIAVLNVDAAPTLASRYGLPAQNDSKFNLKDTNVWAQFRNAAIDFLLVTTLEDIDENHLDGSTVTRSYEYLNGQQTGWWVADAGGSQNSHGIPLIAQKSSGSWKIVKVGISPQLKKDQSLRVTLRSRIFDIQSGEIVASENKTYTRGRSFMASSKGKAEMSMGDLYLAASEDLANWERVLVQDNVFPIKVLKLNDDGVLLNRGSETGIQLNTYYSVWSKGEPIKDPDSGEILGSEEVCVGEVLIRELQSKFARAAITKNNGIAVGGILRLKH